MAENRTTQFRLDVLNHFLGLNEEKTLDELTGEVKKAVEIKYGIGHKVSKDQVRRDIDYMRDKLDAPIAINKGAKNKYLYKYTIPNFSIHKPDILTPKELTDLYEFLASARNVEMMNIDPDLRKIIEKIEGKIERHNEAAKKSAISYKTGPEAEGWYFVKFIQKAILEQRPLQIEYRKYADGAKNERIEIHPHLLKRWDNRFYALTSVAEKGLRQYGLDRIQSVSILDNRKYIPCPLVDPEDYYRHIIGVTNDTSAPIETIELLFLPPMAYYMKRKPWHHSQKIVNKRPAGYPKGSMIIRYRLKVNPELVALILSYSDSVKILGSENLLKKFNERRVGMNGLY
jgi:predicted DNA-binding transcriptional regulator YafY